MAFIKNRSYTGKAWESCDENEALGWQSSISWCSGGYKSTS